MRSLVHIVRNKNNLLLLLLFVEVFLLATIKLGDYDIWYHLRAGQFILSTGSIFHNDPFSYTATDRPWSVQSWLAGVIFYLVHSAGGVDGLILFNASLVTATFFLVYLNMRIFMEDGKGCVPAVMIILVAAFGARFRFMVRPHVMEFLFLAATLYLLNLWRFKGKNRLFLLPVIQLLWVNIHGSHILGLALPCIYLVGALIQGRVRGALPADEAAAGVPVGAMARALLLVFLANVAATFVNPDTYRAFLLPFLITGQKVYMKNIGEWQPLKWHHLWGYGLRYTWGFVTLLAAGGAAFIGRWKRLDVTDLLVFLFFLALAIKGIRLTAEFGIAASVIVFRGYADLVTRRPWSDAPVLKAAVALLLVALVPTVIVPSPTYAFGLGVKPNKFPEQALRFIEENRITGNMFNSFAFGDYLTWRAYPERKVFIHGRNEVFPEEFYVNYLKAHESAQTWRAVTEQYHVTYALLENYGTDFSGKERITHLLGNKEWLPVYWDTTAIVYVKTVPENREVIERWGYRYIRPTCLDFSYLDHYIERGETGPVLAELDRLVVRSPGNEEAYLARAFLLYNLKAFDRAQADVLSALKINPRLAMAHSALGMLFQRNGNGEAALKEYREALRLDPGDVAAQEGLKGAAAGH
jgi:hypothetical protein